MTENDEPTPKPLIELRRLVEQQALARARLLNRQHLPNLETSDPNDSEAAIKEVLSPFEIRLLLGVTDQDGAFDTLVIDLDEESKREFLETRDYLLSELDSYFSKGSEGRALLQKLVSAPHSTPRTIDEMSEFNRISTVNVTSTWLLGRTQIAPFLRVRFTNDDEDLLLDSTLNWSDLAFLSDAFLSSLQDDLPNFQLLGSEGKKKFVKGAEVSDVEDFLRSSQNRIVDLLKDLEDYFG